MSEELKLCKNCKWCQQSWITYLKAAAVLGLFPVSDYFKCGRPTEINPVNGKPKPSNECYRERWKLRDQCGPQAQFFEPKT